MTQAFYKKSTPFSSFVANAFRPSKKMLIFLHSGPLSRRTWPIWLNFQLINSRPEISLFGQANAISGLETRSPIGKGSGSEIEALEAGGLRVSANQPASKQMAALWTKLDDGSIVFREFHSTVVEKLLLSG